MEINLVRLLMMAFSWKRFANFLKDYGFLVGSQIILSSKLSIQNNNYRQEHKCLLEKLFLFERKNHVSLVAFSLGRLLFLILIMQYKLLVFRPFWIYTTANFFKTFSPFPVCVLKILRGCLVCSFKQPFSVFKQHFTHFNALFHPHVFS